MHAPAQQMQLQRPALGRAAVAQRERVAEPGRVGVRQRAREHEPVVERVERGVEAREVARVAARAEALEAL